MASVATLLLLATGLPAACRTGSTPGPGAAAGAAPAGLSMRVRSNILRQDYAGSASCEGCHAPLFAAWRHSPMHEMTRLPAQARIRAPFGGERFRFKDDAATFEQKDGVRFVGLSSAQFGDHVYRVTKVIGGRYREDYAGVEVEAALPNAPIIASHLNTIARALN
jgi:hypothetical protein